MRAKGPEKQVQAATKWLIQRLFGLNRAVITPSGHFDGTYSA
jgi:hypothetical protein